ncbi:MAG: helix-turn-helix transcriptional regulator [Gallionella sp.]|nr:helix-turn-helix transcriptional regulator [Gallionella sp.]
MPSRAGRTSLSRSPPERTRSNEPPGKGSLERLRHRYAVGGQILLLRIKRGMTQEDLAAKTGIQQSEISKIERGVGNPTEDTLATLTHALGARLAVVPERELVAV